MAHDDEAVFEGTSLEQLLRARGNALASSPEAERPRDVWAVITGPSAWTEPSLTRSHRTIQLRNEPCGVHFVRKAEISAR